jgi:hypothetical protein
MRLAFVAGVLIAFSTSHAGAQKVSDVVARTPKKTSDFVRYCADHFDDCRSMVILVDIELVAENKPRVCTIKIKDNAAATKSIVDWLRRREETHAMATKTGIITAIKVLWPC